MRVPSVDPSRPWRAFVLWVNSRGDGPFCEAFGHYVVREEAIRIARNVARITNRNAQNAHVIAQGAYRLVPEFIEPGVVIRVPTFGA